MGPDQNLKTMADEQITVLHFATKTKQQYRRVLRAPVARPIFEIAGSMYTRYSLRLGVAWEAAPFCSCSPNYCKHFFFRFFRTWREHRVYRTSTWHATIRLVPSGTTYKLFLCLSCDRQRMHLSITDALLVNHDTWPYSVYQHTLRPLVMSFISKTWTEWKNHGISTLAW